MNINLERIDKDLHRRAKAQAAFFGETLYEYIGNAIKHIVEADEQDGLQARVASAKQQVTPRPTAPAAIRPTVPQEAQQREIAGTSSVTGNKFPWPKGR